MLLIFPPIAKPCEPPAGIARLHAALQCRGIPCRILDANLESILWTLGQKQSANDTWSRRAARNASSNLSAVRDIGTYNSLDRYSRAVRDLNRSISVFTGIKGVKAGLGDYQHEEFSPVRSMDLVRAAEKPEENPFYDWFSERLPELIEGNGDDAFSAVGMSLNFLSQALCAFAMIGFIRKRFPRLKIVLGGGLVTSWMRRPGWENPFAGLVDHMIAGPGEIPLISIMGSDAGETGHVTPDYSAFPLKDYLSPGFILPYSAASGCWWNRCSFCPERAEGNRFAPISPPNVISDLQSLVSKTTPSLIHFLDNAISPALLDALVSEPPSTPWYGFARFDNRLADHDYCIALKRSGCVMLKLGLESGDQGVLDRLHKGIDLDLASRALENLKKAGIAVYLYLLFGTPAETEAGARRTLEFTARHGGMIRFLNLAIFNMPVYGDDAAEYETGSFYEGDLSLYTGFRHPHGWDRQHVRGFLEREFKRHLAIAPILRNDPPVFTSKPVLVTIEAVMTPSKLSLPEAPPKAASI